MKITSLSYFTPVKTPYTTSKNKQNNNNLSSSETTGIPGVYAYRDYNISFGERLFRTPQNFYEQDFNEKNMPRTLHKYIYDGEDSSFRRTIPPAQAMKEVFGNIKNAKDLDAVRRLYPDEPLFKNLTAHPSRNSREGLLGMLNLMKDDPSYADKTLFKNGKNDLGMYILQKIYIEGKTLKEINKDFAKDVSVYFKSFDITPQDYSAFGIRFPERSFWHSFIATREDFPYVYIPRANSSSSSTGVGGGHNSNIERQPLDIKAPRKFKIKDYQKQQIGNDVVEAKGDAEAIKKKVIKRFKKDDPEASFIVKYFSPIMTVAAEKIHLSEEMRDFAEEEKTYGKTFKGVSMFERFWRANPQLLKEFSHSITDSIELFEEVYAGGGMIPMNKDFEAITKKSLNQKSIDYVNPEFLELLDYTKTIEPARETRYAKHDELQKMWDAHFIERYGDVNAKVDSIIEEFIQEEIPQEEPLEDSKEVKLQRLREEAAKNNAELITLNGKDGQLIHITANIDEAFDEVLKLEARLYPSDFAKLLKSSIKLKTKNDSAYKLAAVTYQIKDMIDDPKIMDEKSFNTQTNQMYQDFYMMNPHAAHAATAAMTDVITRYYKKEDLPLAICRLYVDEFNALMNLRSDLEEDFVKIMQDHRSELNARYNSYLVRPNQTENNKIKLAMLDQLVKYNPTPDLLDSDTQEIIYMLKEMASKVKFKRRLLGNVLSVMINNYKYSKVMLDKSMSNDQKMARFEQLMGTFIHTFLHSPEDTAMLLSALNREIIEAHKDKLTDKTYHTLISAANYFPSHESRHFFEGSVDELVQLDKYYK